MEASSAKISNKMYESDREGIKYSEKTTDGDITEEVKEIKALNRELAFALSEYVRDYDDQIHTLNNLKWMIKRLQTQNDYLKHENAEYRRKLAKITDTWYGRFAMKCYHLLQKTKWRVQKQMRRRK